MTDYLAKLGERDVAAFYRRLALSIQKRFNGDSLAATLLLHWLDGKGEIKIFSATYVKNLSEVRSYLRETARPIFLSQRRPPSGGIGGVVPRIKEALQYNLPPGSYSMQLEGNVETPLSIQAKAAVGIPVDPRELDALYALHGFRVVSDVVVSAAKTVGGKTYELRFARWTCWTTDEYHWNPEKHISVPNPDYGSSEPGAVAPRDGEIAVYHSNAIRVEKAGLAKPFHDRSEPWEEGDPMVTAPATIEI
jgi:hypothetical protein